MGCRAERQGGYQATEKNEGKILSGAKGLVGDPFIQ